MHKYKNSQFESLNLSAIIAQLAQDPGWNKTTATKAAEVYKRYLYIVDKYQQTVKDISPSLEIDAVWHKHILNTKQYQQDTQFLYGKYLHHNPQLQTKRKLEEPNVLANLYQLEFQQELMNVRPRFFWRLPIRFLTTLFRAFQKESRININNRGEVI